MEVLWQYVLNVLKLVWLLKVLRFSVRYDCRCNSVFELQSLLCRDKFILKSGENTKMWIQYTCSPWSCDIYLLEALP